MPDENGAYTVDDMKLTWRQMMEYFDLIPPVFFSGLPEKKWPDGIDSTGMLLIAVQLCKEHWSQERKAQGFFCRSIHSGASKKWN